MIQYGLISRTDAEVLEKTIDLICNEFLKEMIHTCEVGVYSGLTSKGILQYIFNEKKRYTYHTGIDNKRDNEPITSFPENATLIIGNSNEVYNQLEYNSQHLIFQDACHCFSCCVSSFFCYADKVKVGGYVAWHDAGKHIRPFKDFQHGDTDNPDAYISVRKALERIGLMINETSQWRLVFDEADENNKAGGICVFKKLY